MENEKKKRLGARGWLTRATNDLYRALETKDTTYEVVKCAADNFRDRLRRLDGVQDAIELLYEDEADMLELHSLCQLGYTSFTLEIVDAPSWEGVQLKEQPG
jgi:hypothetical protein